MRLSRISHSELVSESNLQILSEKLKQVQLDKKFSRQPIIKIIREGRDK
jgi:hypothetical protein